MGDQLVGRELPACWPAHPPGQTSRRTGGFIVNNVYKMNDLLVGGDE